MNRKAVSLLVAVLFFATAVGGVAASAPDPPQTLDASTCLVGDPFDLASLAAVISDDAPTTKPVTVNQHIIVQMVRRGTMTRTDDEVALGPAQTGQPRPTEPPVDEARLDNVPLHIFNTRTQFEFRVTFSDELLDTIGDCHERKGMNAPGGPASRGVVEGRLSSYLPAFFQRAGTQIQAVPAGASAFAPDGWSNGVDTRALRTPTTVWPWRTITQSTFSASDTQSRCTMTLVGPRHLITAAHCLVNFGTTNWKARQLVPARNGPAVMPYGSTQMTPNPPPGEEAWYIVPGPWMDPNTPSNGTEEYQWDIGMVLMLDRLGDQTGWMGYGAFPASDLNQRNQINRGYPRCDTQEAPANCQPHRLYGDSQYCDVGVYHHPGSNNWNREFSFDCDMGRGHSGSALYHYRYIPSWGSNGPYVAAVVSWHECLDNSPGQCAATDTYPNHARRITPWVRDAISWLREQFP